MLTQGEENLKRKEEGGEVVAVLEKRAVDVKREGYFIVQVRELYWKAGCPFQLLNPFDVVIGIYRML